MMDEGRPPSGSEQSEADQKHLAERIAETRKSAETIGGWCLGSIIAASLRNAAGPNRLAITLGVAGLVLGLVGSTTWWTPQKVDRAQLDQHLRRAYTIRYAIRASAMSALLAALLALLVDVWH